MSVRVARPSTADSALTTVDDTLDVRRSPKWIYPVASPSARTATASTTRSPARNCGVAGTVDLLRRSLRPGGMVLIGEPYWRREPLDQATVEGCHAPSEDDFRLLRELLEQFGELGCDVVEMVLADQDGWDRYVAAQWLNTHRRLDARLRSDEPLTPAAE